MFETPTNVRQQALIGTGNETFDKFLGGGLLHSSLNLFERQGSPSKILDTVLINSLSSSTLCSKNNLLVINFDTSYELKVDKYLLGLPQPRSVKTELLYKDVRGRSATAKIRIAWRYSSRNASPSDKLAQTRQMDFGFSLSEYTESNNLGQLKVINVMDEDHKDGFSVKNLLGQIESEVNEFRKTNQNTNIIFKDILHPFSPLIDQPDTLLELFLMLRCFSRSLTEGSILITYDIDMCSNHHLMKQDLYNLADCVVSFFSYETGHNIASGYKHTDGTLDYVKVPKINSFGLHFQRELSDWGYRFTKNNGYFVVDELSLPPSHDDEDDGVVKKRIISDEVDMFDRKPTFTQVGPLEDFREVAKTMLPREL